MTSEVVAQIEAQVHEMRSAGAVPDDLEEDLEARFEQAAEEALSAASFAPREPGPDAGTGSSPGLAGLVRQATLLARRRFGPALRDFERRGVLGAARTAQTAWLQVYVAVDHLDRVAAQSAPISRVLSVLRPKELAGSGSGAVQPAIEGALLAWVLDRLGGVSSAEPRDVPGPVLHAECGDGRVLEALAARGLEVLGADPRLSVRVSGNTSTVAAGALEYLGAAPSNSLGGLLLSGVVDRMRPGAARALAQLAGRCLAPGGVVVLVSARPEVVVAIDPVAADLAPGRPIHPVTWCHLLAHFGLVELSVFEPDDAEPDVFAVSARRPVTPANGAFGGRT
jgi:hypothetical protein